MPARKLYDILLFASRNRYRQSNGQTQRQTERQIEKKMEREKMEIDRHRAMGKHKDRETERNMIEIDRPRERVRQTER